MHKDIYYNVNEFLHHILKIHLKPGDTVADCTAGNGNDTVFLAETVGPEGMVFAFDVQEEALARTAEHLDEKGMGTRCVLVHDSHAAIDSYPVRDLSAAVFNLGYLPGGNREIRTVPAITLEALEKAAGLMKKDGILAAVCYSGHAGGPEEAEAVTEFFRGLSCCEWDSVSWSPVNKKGAPFLVSAKRR